MKKSLYLIIILLICNSAIYSQAPKPTNNFTLKGTIANHKIHLIWLRYTTEHETKVLFKAPVKNGSFLFKGFIASPVYAEFFFDNEPQPRSDFGFNMLFLNPGNMTVSLVKDDTEHTKITGSVMQDDWDYLNTQKQPAIAARNNLDVEINKIGAKGNTPENHKAVEKLGDKKDQFNEQLKQIDFTFIKTHPNSYLSPYLMDNYFIEKTLKLDSAEMLYNSFTQRVKNSIAGKKIGSKIAAHRASATGSFAPLFSLKDIHGKTIDLKSIRGKNYVLLYFWASWCLPQKGEGPFLIRTYNKYHGKGLEVIGISQDLFERDWKKAIVENHMGTWHNILSGYIQTRYNIEGMPPSILVLIDKQGKIIDRYIGDHVEWEKTGDNERNLIDLDKKLTEIFSN